MTTFKMYSTVSGILLTILLVSGAATYKNFLDLAEVNRLETNSRIMLKKTEIVLGQVTDAETGQRGYIITGNEDYLRPYHAAVATIDKDVKELRFMTRDNVGHQQMLDTLEPLIIEKLGGLANRINLRKTKGFDAAAREVRIGKGKDIMDKIRKNIDRMEEDIRKSMEQKRKEVELKSKHTAFYILFGSSLAFLIVSLTSIFTYRELNKRKQVEKVLQKAYDLMEQKVEERTAELQKFNTALQKEFSEHKRTEEELQEREKSYRGVADSITDVFFEMDRDLKYTYWNRASENLTGIFSKDVIGKSLYDIFPDIKGTIIEEAYLEVLKSKQSKTFVTDLKISDKEYIFDINAYPSVLGISVIAKDITERKKTEDKLILLKEAIECLPIGLTISNIEGRIIYTNTAEIKMHGYTVEELIGKQVRVLAPSTLWKSLPFEQLCKLGIWKRETLNIRRNGEVFPVQLTSVVVNNTKGVPIGIITTCEDITERKQIEQTLNETMNYLHNLFNYANAPIIVWDASFRITEFNHAFEHLTGYNASEVIGNELSLLFPEASRKESLDKINNTLRGEYWESVEIPILRKDDSIRIALWNSANIYTDDGSTLLATIAQGQDITERKRAESELHEVKELLKIHSSSLLKSIENERRHIARELHDEMGPQLTVLKINLQNMLRLKNYNECLPHININIGIIETLINLVRNLSLNLRPSTLDDLGLAPALRWYINRLEQEANIVIDFIADPLYHRLPSEIENACFRVAQEALTNVIKHAKAQEINIEVRQIENSLQLTIRDNGIGFNVKSARDRAQRGESFGLLGMQERVLLSGGTIDIESTPGKGTAIKACFPIKEDI